MEDRPNKLKTIWKDWAEKLVDDQDFVFSVEKISDIIGNIFCPGPFYFYIFDFSSFELAYIHENVEAILGVNPTSITFNQILERVHPEDLAFAQACERLAGHFFSEINPSEVKNYKTNYCFRLKAGDRYKMILHQAIAHTTDENGHIRTTLGVHSDVSHLLDINTRKISFLHIGDGPSFMGFDPTKGSLKQLFHPGPPETILTLREREVLQHLAEGDTVKDISKKLYLSDHTVRTHRNNLRRKLNCKNTPQMVAKAIRSGLI